MSVLASVQTGKVKKPRRIMLYGVHGIGKTTWATSAPNAIVLPTEEGTNDIDCDRFPVATSFDEFIGYIGALLEENHDYKTAVVDSLDWLEPMIWAETIKRRPTGEKGKPIKHIEDYGFAKGYTYALEIWQDIIDGLAALRRNCGMTIVMIAHYSVSPVQDPENAQYDRFGPRIHKHASGKIQEWCDEVLFARYQTHTIEEDAGFGRKISRGIGKGDRIINTTDRPAHAAKNRLDLPDTLPLVWDEFAKYL